MELESDDDYEEMFVCSECGDLVPFYAAIFSEGGAMCIECADSIAAAELPTQTP